ncbi:hypothetical protein B0T21DRAFT_384164 [Apiosordaria backusii]|uniref:Heterokaryon incompatibility domain-containing protein n=1 Tax=Apiosordaria backusii TaxID=314023 RepID=A0AA40BM59_9PEZI|nr:hypothetical protein B0T21DRAFT_384164 [Apiosordaria backusii]
MMDFAVLSWRWDGDLKTRGSKNIASAIYQAKRMGVRYLFLDLVSIDQSLSGEALIQQVVEFSSLYSTIPVIAAYDMEGEEFEDTMYRPWIFNEARLYRYNPTKMVYVGHSNQGTKHDPGSSPFGGEPILGVDIWRYEFGKTLGHVWTGSFIETIIGVLCDKIGMSDVSDLKFIIPPYARVFTTAYRKMSRNDYLLTAAILCRVHAPPRGKLNWDAGAMDYGRYSFKEVNSEGSSSSWTWYGIFLDGTRIGLWKHKYNEWLDYDWYLFDVLPDAERLIFNALGLSDSDWGEFIAQVEARRHCLVIDREDKVPVPKVEIVAVTLP